MLTSPLRQAQGKPLTPSPNSRIEYAQDILFGEGEENERGLRPLSLRTPAFTLNLMSKVVE